MAGAGGHASVAVPEAEHDSKCSCCFLGAELYVRGPVEIGVGDDVQRLGVLTVEASQLICSSFRCLVQDFVHSVDQGFVGFRREFVAYYYRVEVVRV